MARNEEKAQSMLNRYLRTRAEGADGNGSAQAGHPRRRPHLATLCEDVDEAERWWRQVQHDISRKVTDIQNASLGTERIRDLNDEINKLLRENRHWERRIRDLGGRDRTITPAPLTSSAASHRGYFYFGAARDLPGVPALLRAAAPRPRPPTLIPVAELRRRADTPAYTATGDDDAELVAAERAREEQDRAARANAWEEADAGMDSVDAAETEWSEEWRQYVGVAPPEGAEREKLLEQIALEIQKREACMEADLIAGV